MSEDKIVELLKSGMKIAYLRDNYGIPVNVTMAIKKKHKLKREYGNRYQDKTKKIEVNGKLVYKSKYPNTKQAIANEFSGAF